MKECMRWSQRLVSLLGRFYIAKAAEHCIDKLNKGSRFDDTLVKTRAFGVKIVDQVINGTHYERSMRSFLILEDVIEVLKCKTFWIKQRPLKKPISILKELSNAFEKKRQIKSRKHV